MTQNLRSSADDSTDKREDKQVFFQETLDKLDSELGGNWYADFIIVSNQSEDDKEIALSKNKYFVLDSYETSVLNLGSLYAADKSDLEKRSFLEKLQELSRVNIRVMRALDNPVPCDTLQLRRVSN